MQVKEEVLSILLENMDSFVSGTALAERLACSRMAISKAVSALNERGYEIEINKGKGYKISSEADVLSVEMLSHYLAPLNNITICVEANSNSTNDRAKELLSMGAKTPLLVVAESQSGGKGRLGRRFASPPGGLYFSLCLNSKQFGNPELITVGAALAEAEVLEPLVGEPISIKWVNDLFYRGKKVSGILTEGIVNLECGGLESVIIGIGVNLKNDIALFPEEVREIATSFYENGNCPYPRAFVIAEIVKAILKIQNTEFVDRYKKRCFILGMDVRVLKNGSERGAHTLDINDRGHLIVRYLDNGEIAELSSGEISVRF